MKKITAVILTKNEEQMLPDCLNSLTFCDELLVIDSGSTDNTLAIARKHHAVVLSDTSTDFSAKRNLGLKHAHSEWILYIDADERVSEALATEIKNVDYLATNEKGENTVAYKIKRKNYYLGEHAWPEIEQMERLFRKDALQGWVGALHESPQIKGEVGVLDGYLSHFSHRDVTSMVQKTNQWSNTEAALRFKAHHPPMSWWRFPRVMMSAFYNSYISQGGWKVGTAGLIESIFQAYSAFITYAKLWELQNEKNKLSKSTT